MEHAIANALEILAARGEALRTDCHFDWPVATGQAVHRLRFDHLETTGRRLCLTAIVGGASSGKSTVFNNLLEGHIASRITARGHSTLGPILALPEHAGELLEDVGHGPSTRLFPGFQRTPVELDADTSGRSDAVTIVSHAVDALRDVVLVDLPDFSSQEACHEGDIALSLLPWFDKIILVVDNERWHDRQSISKLRTLSIRSGQHRWVLFNRTREGLLKDDDRAALAQQAQRLGADGMSVLEYRRGRGFRRFPPGTLDDVCTFLQATRPERTGHLLAQVAEAANAVLNQNEERTARLHELRRALDTAVESTLPATRECMISLMTPSERQQLQLVSRVLRIGETRHWVAAQKHRLQNALKQVPIVGAVVGSTPRDMEAGSPETSDRAAIAESYFDACSRRQAHEARRTVQASAFWDEIRRWSGLEPTERTYSLDARLRGEVREAARTFDAALARWNDKVESECRGISPHVKGAIGVGTIALAVVLIAVPGPAVALTLASAKAAIGAALTQLIAATGAGALLGRPMGRLVAVIEEKLLGSPEFDAVREATVAFRALLESTARQDAQRAITEATALVLDRNDPLVRALEVLREPPEAPR